MFCPDEHLHDLLLESESDGNKKQRNPGVSEEAAAKQKKNCREKCRGRQALAPDAKVSFALWADRIDQRDLLESGALLWDRDGWDGCSGLIERDLVMATWAAKKCPEHA